MAETLPGGWIAVRELSDGDKLIVRRGEILGIGRRVWISPGDSEWPEFLEALEAARRELPTMEGATQILDVSSNDQVMLIVTDGASTVGADEILAARGTLSPALGATLLRDAARILAHLHEPDQSPHRALLPEHLRIDYRGGVTVDGVLLERAISMLGMTRT